jgi:hypothetical protein
METGQSLNAGMKESSLICHLTSIICHPLSEEYDWRRKVTLPPNDE